jgi:hypothetical protein
LDDDCGFVLICENILVAVVSLLPSQLI